jgi:hypothetical protein
MHSEWEQSPMEGRGGRMSGVGACARARADDGGATMDSAMMVGRRWRVPGIARPRAGQLEDVGGRGRAEPRATPLWMPTVSA